MSGNSCKPYRLPEEDPVHENFITFGLKQNLHPGEVMKANSRDWKRSFCFPLEGAGRATVSFMKCNRIFLGH